MNRLKANTPPCVRSTKNTVSFTNRQIADHSLATYVHIASYIHRKQQCTPATQLHCGMYMQVCSRNQVQRVTFEEVSK